MFCRALEQVGVHRIIALAPSPCVLSSHEVRDNSFSGKGDTKTKHYCGDDLPSGPSSSKPAVYHLTELHCFSPAWRWRRSKDLLHICTTWRLCPPLSPVPILRRQDRTPLITLVNSWYNLHCGEGSKWNCGALPGEKIRWESGPAILICLPLKTSISVLILCDWGRVVFGSSPTSVEGRWRISTRLLYLVYFNWWHCTHLKRLCQQAVQLPEELSAILKKACTPYCSLGGE